MDPRSLLTAPTETELDALAACWGAPSSDVEDATRVWVQTTDAGDALGQQAAELSCLAAAAATGIRLVQHRTVAHDAPSIALAQRCGFRVVSLEHIVKEATE